MQPLVCFHHLSLCIIGLYYTYARKHENLLDTLCSNTQYSNLVKLFKFIFNTRRLPIGLFIIRVICKLIVWL